MLKGIDPVVTADLLHVLMRMGHGDDILLCDVNHPAVTIARETTHGHLLDMAGCDLARATEALLAAAPRRGRGARLGLSEPARAQALPPL